MSDLYWLTDDVSEVHGGTVGLISVSYSLPVSDRVFLNARSSLGFADDRYARRYFGVPASSASPLTPFRAQGGARDVGVSLAATSPSHSGGR